MASIAPSVLGRDASEIGALVEYLKGRGVSQRGVPEILLQHPKMLEYKVEGGVLTKGPKARIAVDVMTVDGKVGAVISGFFGGMAVPRCNSRDRPCCRRCTTLRITAREPPSRARPWHPLRQRPLPTTDVSIQRSAACHVGRPV